MKVKLITPVEIIKLSIIHAIEGARFAKKSLGKIDSDYDCTLLRFSVTLGKKDLELAIKLSNNNPASGHDKFLQSIPLIVDISWTRSMWQEFDTYRIGVSKQSESTMHTIIKDDFSLGDFELDPELSENPYVTIKGQRMVQMFLDMKEDEVDADFKHGDISETVYRETLRKILPECFIQNAA